MAKIPNPFSSVQIEFRRSRPLTKIVVCGAIVLSMAALITLSWSGSQLKREIAQLRQEAAELAAENAELKEKIDNLDSLEGVEDIAQSELEMVDPDTIIIDPNP
jgi:cell division protein FtsB